MPTEDSRWRSFGQNLLWFVVTLVLLMVLFKWYPAFVFLAAMWLVGLGWGGWLAYQLGQLLTSDDRAEASRQRMSAVVMQARDYQAKINAAIEEEWPAPPPHWHRWRARRAQRDRKAATGPVPGPAPDGPGAPRARPDERSEAPQPRQAAIRPS